MILFPNIKKLLLLLFLCNSTAFADDLKSTMPPPNEEDRIYTLNNMGAMCNKFDALNSSFIDYAIKENRKTMDVGCAYGNTAIEILQHGGNLIAIDLDERHLEILVNRITDPEERERLETIAGNYLEITSISPNSIDAIQMSHMLHFHKGKEIEIALNNAYAQLKPDGRIFISVVTPFIKAWKNIIPLYEQNKIKKNPWPSEIDNIWSFNKDLEGRIPKLFHPLDKSTLKDALENAGFLVETIEYEGLPYTSERLHLNNKEILIAIAKKPSP